MIYLHPITENRLSESLKLNFQMYLALRGQQYRVNSVIATTKWGNTQTISTIEAQHEQDLREFCKHAIDGGVMFVRHSDDAESAHTIIRRFLASKDQPDLLQIQHELMNERKKVSQTHAGQLLVKNLRRAAQARAGSLLNTENDLTEARRKGDEKSRYHLSSWKGKKT